MGKLKQNEILVCKFPFGKFLSVSQRGFGWNLSRLLKLFSTTKYSSSLDFSALDGSVSNCVGTRERRLST